MAEHPMIMSGLMVRAILAGAKAQTRRVVKPQPTEAGLEWREERYGFAAWQDPLLTLDEFSEDDGSCQRRCPFGRVGDTLWVRETWAERGGRVIYRADGSSLATGYELGFLATTWRPSIFMPRWASRLTLRVTDLRVERLHDITPADIAAEGLDAGDYGGFAALWDSLNAARGYPWSSSPWIWVIGFARAD